MTRRTKWRRLAALLVGGALALAGCSGDSSDESGKAQPLRIGTTFNPADSVDPNTASSPGSMMLMSYLYGSLAMEGRDRPKMALAESVTPNATGDAWTIKLRSGATFSNGAPVTGQDVLASLRHISQAPAFSTLYREVDFQGSSADESSVTLKLSTPRSDLLDSSIAMLSPVAPGGKFEGVGPGPYLLEKGDASTGYRLKANPRYWGGAPKIENVELKTIPDASAQASALKNGEIDYAYGLDATSVATLRGDPDVEIPKPTLEQAVAMDLVLNTRVAPFDDPEVRRAAKLALDRGKMVKTLLGETGEQGNDMLGKGYPTYPRDIAQVEADKAQARKIFAEKGVTSFAIKTADVTPGLVASAELMVQEFKEVGVAVTLDKVDSQSFFAQLDQLYATPAFTMYWLNRRPMAEFPMQVAADSPYNVSGYSSQTLVANFEAAKRTLDETERDRMVGEVSREIHETGGDLVWGYQKQISAYRKGLKGFVTVQSMPWIADATFAPAS